MKKDRRVSRLPDRRHDHPASKRSYGKAKDERTGEAPFHEPEHTVPGREADTVEREIPAVVVKKEVPPAEMLLHRFVKIILILLPKQNPALRSSSWAI